MGFFSSGLSPLPSFTKEVPRNLLTKAIRSIMWDKWLHQLSTCYRSFWQSVKSCIWIGFISWKNTIKMSVIYKITSMNIYIFMSRRFSSYFMKSVCFWLTFFSWKYVREEIMSQKNSKSTGGFQDIGITRVRGIGTYDQRPPPQCTPHGSSQSETGKTKWWVNRIVAFLPSVECNLIELLFIM